MLQPKYMTYDGHHLSANNKLKKEVQEYLTGLDRTLIEHKELNFMKNQIIKNIERFNKKHHRCKPLQPSWWQHKGDWMLSGVGFSNFTIYKITKIIL